MHINDISGQIVDASYKIHYATGPGLLESVYQAMLVYELKKRRLDVIEQFKIPVVYDGVEIGTGYLADLLVGDLVIVELKSVERIIPVHAKQLLTYLKLADKPLGLLINFNAPLIKRGITRIANNLKE